MGKAYPLQPDGKPTPSYQWDNPGVVYDRYGHSVDTSGDVWVLTDPSITELINWKMLKVNRSIVDASKAYIAHCIEFKAARTAKNMFQYFYQSMRDYHHCWEYPLKLNGLLGVLEAYRAEELEYKFHWIRKWYVWCADIELPGFYQDIADELLEYTIKGNEKGVAVLIDDEEEGPLDNVEYDLLRSVVKSGVGSALERICIMLCMEVGANPKNFVLLEVRDFFKRETKSGDFLYSLHVPRIKKRLSSRSVRARSISKHLGLAIESLIESNKLIADQLCDVKCPILRRDRKRNISTRSLKRFQFHLSTSDFCRLVVNYAKTARIVSHRTGDILHLTPRRLRYTFATRLVEQGASPAVLADALDHTDLQHIGVYYKARGKTVEAINKALECNPYYRDIISRFRGTVVDRKETESLHTVHGDTLTYRSLGGIGGCGAKFFCKRYPPLSCYLCPSFQAWKDGPHQEMLDELRIYARKVAATSGCPVDRIANQVDDVILAISQLLQRIDEMG